MTKPPRLPPTSRDAMSDAQKQVLDAILAGPRGNLDGPFLGWIHSPQLAHHAQQLGAFCRYHSGLPLKLSELAILVTAAKWQCQAEWFIHHPIALRAGLSPAVAEQLRTGMTPRFLDGQEELVWRFASELYDDKRVSDATYGAMVDAFGLETVVNTVALLGYYALVAMTLNVFQMRAEGQDNMPFGSA